MGALVEEQPKTRIMWSFSFGQKSTMKFREPFVKKDHDLMNNLVAPSRKINKT